jgi:streptomycin 6-kinase
LRKLAAGSRLSAFSFRLSAFSFQLSAFSFQLTPMIIPVRLRESCAGSPDRRAWLDTLPHVVEDLQRRWSLQVDRPFDDDEVSCSWVAPATRADGTPAVLKIGLPHFEAAHEIEGLRFWDGLPTVRLLEAEDGLNAMLLERCEPGTPLRTLPETDQDTVIAGLLRRLWRVPRAPHPFRPLSTMIGQWMEETNAASSRWSDAGLVRAGLDAFEMLIRAPGGDVLLATDLHAGNVLRATRERWLAIDPKPFVGDPAYDATQHLLNCRERLRRDPPGTIRRFADLLGVDADRVRAWLFARLAAEPGNSSEESMQIARTLA